MNPANIQRPAASTVVLVVVEWGDERRGPRADSAPTRYVAVVALALLSTLAVLANSLPLLGVPDVDSIENALSIEARPFLSAGSEVELSTPEPHFSPTRTRYLVSVAGKMRCGDEDMGRPEAVADGRYAIEGPKDNPDPHLASERGHVPAEPAHDETSPKHSGADRKAPTAPWGRETALGQEVQSARGKIWGDPVEDADGKNGLGLARVEGGIAKRLDWSALGTPEASARVVHTGLRVFGPLRPSLVTRTVATRFDQFRACYERTRAKSPKLGGRLDLKFDVGKDGRVNAVDVEHSSISDPELMSCVAASVRDLAFAPAESAMSVVTYPLFFEPGSARSQAARLARREPPREVLPACCTR